MKTHSHHAHSCSAPPSRWRSPAAWPPRRRRQPKATVAAETSAKPDAAARGRTRRRAQGSGPRRRSVRRALARYGGRLGDVHVFERRIVPQAGDRRAARARSAGRRAHRRRHAGQRRGEGRPASRATASSASTARRCSAAPANCAWRMRASCSPTSTTGKPVRIGYVRDGQHRRRERHAEPGRSRSS